LELIRVERRRLAMAHLRDSIEVAVRLAIVRRARFARHAGEAERFRAMRAPILTFYRVRS
jgi:hypothetical protein